jgi:hypothetical protein
MDAQRLAIISDTTKHYADILLSILSCRGFLSLPPPESKLKAKTTAGNMNVNFKFFFFTVLGFSW